jgi:hypothetical protein
MKNVLDGAVAYLGGPIDQAPDNGIEWRLQIKKMLEERDIHLAVLDPTHKLPGLTNEIGSEKGLQNRFKKNGNWEALRRLMKQIVRADLRMIDLCDFLITMIDVDIHACGTYQEIVTADIEHKPILLIIKGGKARCPSWLFGIIHYDYIFDSIEECVDYLEKVNKGGIILDDKWVLIRKGIRKLEMDAMKEERKGTNYASQSGI